MIGWIINIILFLLILLYGADSKKMSTPKGRKRFLLLCFVQLLSIQILKDYTILPDELTYKYYYEHFTWDLYETFEIGFRFFVDFLTKISTDFYLFIIVYGIIQVITHIWAINKYSTSLLLTYILFITTSFYALFVVRQYIAIAICLWSIPFIVNRKLIPFLLLTALAMTFHGSAIVWIITYALSYVDLKSNLKISLFFFLGIFLINYGIDNFFSYALESFDKMQYYMTDVEEQYTWKTLAVSLAVVVFSTICYGKNVRELTGSRKLFYFMAWITVAIDIINFMGTSFSAFYRVSPYFSISTAFLLPDALMCLKKPIRYIAIPVIIALFVWNLIAGINQQRGFGFII